VNSFLRLEIIVYSFLARIRTCSFLRFQLKATLAQQIQIQTLFKWKNFPFCCEKLHKVCRIL